MVMECPYCFTPILNPNFTYCPFCSRSLRTNKGKWDREKVYCSECEYFNETYNKNLTPIKIDEFCKKAKLIDTYKKKGICYQHPKNKNDDNYCRDYKLKTN